MHMRGCGHAEPQPCVKSELGVADTVRHTTITHVQKTEGSAGFPTMHWAKGAVRDTGKCHQEKGKSRTAMEEVQCAETQRLPG